jgi:hypothetical protein
MSSTNLDSYVQALIPNSYKVMGIKLRPFSLGSYFLMRRFNCAFSNENIETNGNIQDLLLAVSICSRTYNQFLDWISDPEQFQSWSKEWGDKIKLALENDQINILIEVNKFKIYMKDSVQVPKIWNNNEDGESKTSGAHWSHNIYIKLISKIGYIPEQALDMPLSQASFDYYKHLEDEGSITFMTDFEIDQIKGEVK